MKKRIAIILLNCIFISLLAFRVKADSQNISNENGDALVTYENGVAYVEEVYELPDGGNVTVRIPASEAVSYDRIYEVLSDPSISDGDQITLFPKQQIEELTFQEETSNAVSPAVDEIVEYIYVTSDLDYGTPRVSETYKLISVAKGMTLQLEKEFKRSYTTSYEPAPYNASSLEFNMSYTVTIKTTVSFSGPGENSEYNSREYKVKIYERDVF